MRRITFLKTFFLALILFIGTGNAWGETVNYSMSSLGLANNTVTGTGTYTVNAVISISFAQNSSGTAPTYYTSGSAVRLYQNATKGGSIKISVASGYKITDVTITRAGGDGDGPAGYLVDGGSEAGTFADGTISNQISGINATSYVEYYSKGTDSNKRAYIVSISLTYESVGPPCTPSNLAFASSTATKIMGDEPFAITPTTLNETTAIAYSSTNADVATVNSSTGEVTILGVGTTKIKADQAAGTHNSIDYCVGSVEYTLTVAPLAAPVATAASAITPSGFTANWEAVTGATSYILDVYTKEGSAVELFISEYGEGSSNNKYIEIFNGTGTSVDLSHYSLKQAYNGEGWDKDVTYTLALSGTLANNDVYVIANNQANKTILDIADLIVTHDNTNAGGRIVSFTGNDAIGLFKNNVLIDVFGDPTSNSTISVAGYSTYGGDHTIVRKSTINSGNTNWTASSGTSVESSEWIGYAQDTWGYVGSHTIFNGVTITPVTNSPFTVSGTSQVITALSEATDYYYRVRAVNGTVESANSNEIKTTTSVNTTPTIVVAESAVPGMSALVGSSDTKTVTISGQNLSADISLTLTGDNASMFSLDKTTITPTNGSVTNQVVTITYTPTNVGTHSVELKLSSSGVAEVTCALTGTTLMSAPTASAATNIATGGFTANWSEVEGVSGYELSVSLSNNKLYENFDTQSGTGGNDNQWSGNVASSKTVDLTSWTLTNAYGADKCIKVGTGSSQGIAKTPVLNLNGNATLTFRAGAWNGTDEQAELLLAIEGGGSLSKSSVIMTKGAFTSYSVDITGGTANTKISFKGKQAKDSRFFLDDVKVFTLTPITNSPFAASSSPYTISGLSPSSVYTYTVQSKVDEILSPASNEVTAITAINGAINANSLPACPDCNIAIADGGHLTVEANTTYASITAEAGSKITVADGKSLTVTDLVLENDLNKAATVIGNISSTSAEVRQQLGTARNWYLASAISGASIKEIPQIVAGAPRKTKAAIAPSYEYLKEYNETTGVWDDATDWVVGRGYILKPTNDYAQYAFTGTSLTSGNQTTALTRTATINGSNNFFKGYNLVGNPYPSYLNINALIGHTANYYDIAHTIWYRTHDGNSWSFPTFNAKSGVGVPSDNLGLVPPMQAFWVQATQATNLTFENSMRLHNPSDSNVPFKAPRQQANSVLRLQIDNGAVKDETVLYLNELAANALDSFDSPKMMNNGTTVPNIFTLAGGEKLIINGMNELANGTEIPLGVQANAGTFTVRATEFSNFAEGDRVELLDKLTGTLTDITASDYAFSSATNINTADRFALRFGRVATDKQNLSNDGLTVFTHHNCIHVAASELALGSAIRVYNQVGQLVASQPVSGALNVVNAQLHAGVYVVSVNNITVKVILK